MRRTSTALLSGGAALATAVALAACGGSSPSAPAASAASGGATSPPLAIYRATLTGNGSPAGAPLGSGFAIVALHPGQLLCWRFAHLHGFTVATHAWIYAGAQPRGGAIRVSSGPRLHHRGCTRLTTTTAKSIASRPSGYSVAVDSVRYPGGAVRGRL